MAVLKESPWYKQILEEGLQFPGGQPPMNPKHRTTLELPKILERLAGHCAFSAGKALARSLTPSTDPEEVRYRLAVTREARTLLRTHPGTSIGGARDVRPLLEQARREATLLPGELLDVRQTLVAGRTLRRTLTRLEADFPRLAGIARRIEPVPGLIAEIGRCINDDGEVRDEASPALAQARRTVRLAHRRLQEKLQRIVTSPQTARFLQEPIITQRAGRYVIPLRAEFKGRIPGIVHDQSASGATLFIEPLSVVELNNRWREARLTEEREVQRVLARLTAQVAEEAEAIRRTVEALAELDLAFAKAAYADLLEAEEPRMLAFGEGKRRPVLRLRQARHPLLDPQTVVPIDLELDEETFIVVITGPNTGGKTVTLKTVGLLALMAQCGLHIPAAQESALPVFRAIYADIGDEQSIEQSLSTFSAHMTNILSFLERADDRSLVLLDELGAGTDPAEGSALARALLDYLRARRVTTLVATHYPELKVYAHATPGVVNASVEFDPETLAPTYRLRLGLPGRSNAFAIAARLGAPPEVIAQARQMMAETDLRAEEMLAEIARARREAEEARREAQMAQADLQAQAEALRQRLAAINEERRRVLNEARQQAQAELEHLREEVARLRRRLRQVEQVLRFRSLEGAEQPIAEESPAAVLQEVEAHLEALERAAGPEPAPPPPAPYPQRPIRPGDTVWVPTLQTTGQVMALEDGEAEVQVGRMRVRARADTLQWRPPEPAPEVEEPPRLARTPAPSPGVELDLRGLTVEEALPRLDRYLDAAALAGLPWGRIIHGKGTGRLRRAVRRMLADHPLVQRYEPGRENEGGDGVTIVHLASS